MTLRRRIIVGFVAVAAVLIATNLALGSTFHSYLLRRVDQQLSSGGVSLGRGRPDGIGGENGNNALTEYYIGSFDPESDQITQYVSPFGKPRPSPKLTGQAIADHVVQPGERGKPGAGEAQTGAGKWGVSCQVG